MITISKKVANFKNHRYVVGEFTVKYNADIKTVSLRYGTIVLGAHKKGAYFVVVVAEPVAIEGDSPKLVNYTLRTRGNGEYALPMDMEENMYMHHILSETFTSRHISAHLFIDMAKTEDTLFTQGDAEDENEPTCKTTGLHSTDFNGKCFKCGTETRKVELT